MRHGRNDCVAKKKWRRERRKRPKVLMREIYDNLEKTLLLTERQRLIFHARKIDGKSLQQVVELLDSHNMSCSYSTVAHESSLINNMIDEAMHV